jgi:RAB protein geranylgeranyltransferase component A
MDKYIEFRLVSSILHFDGKEFKSVPLSKGKIFESKDLGLMQKKLLLNTFHSLMQIYNKYMNVVEDQNSTK